MRRGESPVTVRPCTSFSAGCDRAFSAGGCAKKSQRPRSTPLRRSVRGAMRSGEEPPVELTPQPGLAHLDRLIAQVEAAGLPVTLRVEGERPELSIGIDLSAYRIVQEGLANTLKHAKGAHAEVERVR